ncbi:unnamed protein product [Nippostrongylus brasiliensis]|uniref:Uncharacterized protein n=1 Tax=Nippostrongylus brasiliensis TaxID=27835 RepID=A0A0N4YKQ3_NIPBR|nr:unnamed protein product [Nippostrongylus brasiliensis]
MNSFCLQVYVYRIQPALLRASPRSCTLYVETESNLAFRVVTCSEHVHVLRRDSRRLSYIGATLNLSLISALVLRSSGVTPAIHLNIFIGRPALGSVQSKRPYDCPVDLRLQTFRYFSVAKYAGRRTPLRPSAAYSSVHLAAEVSIAGYR